MLTLFILGAVVLSLSAFWQPLRRAIVPNLPLGRWRALSSSCVRPD